MDKQLLKEFKNIEKQLIKKLKDCSIEISENEESKDIIKAIKEHIIKLNDIEILFENYENLAKKLYLDEEDDDEQSELKPVASEKKKTSKADSTKKEQSQDTKKKLCNSKKEKLVDLSTKFSK